MLEVAAGVRVELVGVPVDQELGEGVHGPRRFLEVVRGDVGELLEVPVGALQVLGQPLPLDGRALPVGDVARDAEQVQGLAVVARHGDLLGVEPALAAGGVDGLLGDVEELAAGEHRPVLAGEEVGLVLREEVVVVAPEHLLSGEAEQLLAGAVEPDEAQLAGVLDEDHVGDVLDDAVEEQRVSLEGVHVGAAHGEVAGWQGRQVGALSALAGRDAEQRAPAGAGGAEPADRQTAGQGGVEPGFGRGGVEVGVDLAGDLRVAEGLREATPDRLGGVVQRGRVGPDHDALVVQADHQRFGLWPGVVHRVPHRQLTRVGALRADGIHSVYLTRERGWKRRSGGTSSPDGCGRGGG